MKAYPDFGFRLAAWSILLLAFADGANATSYVRNCLRGLPEQLRQRCDATAKFALTVSADGTPLTARVLSVSDELLRPHVECIAQRPQLYFPRFEAPVPPGTAVPVEWRLSDESCASRSSPAE